MRRALSKSYQWAVKSGGTVRHSSSRAITKTQARRAPALLIVLYQRSTGKSQLLPVGRAEVTVVMVCAQKGQVAHHLVPQIGGQNSGFLSLLEIFLLLNRITSRQEVWGLLPARKEQSVCSGWMLFLCYSWLLLIEIWTVNSTHPKQIFGTACFQEGVVFSDLRSELFGFFLNTSV